jgi:hypothetical protein
MLPPPNVSTVVQFCEGTPTAEVKWKKVPVATPLQVVSSVTGKLPDKVAKQPVRMIWTGPNVVISWQVVLAALTVHVWPQFTVPVPVQVLKSSMTAAFAAELMNGATATDMTAVATTTSRRLTNE